MVSWTACFPKRLQWIEQPNRSKVSRASTTFRPFWFVTECHGRNVQSLGVKVNGWCKKLAITYVDDILWFNIQQLLGSLHALCYHKYVLWFVCMVCALLMSLRSGIKMADELRIKCLFGGKSQKREELECFIRILHFAYAPFSSLHL